MWAKWRELTVKQIPCSDVRSKLKGRRGVRNSVPVAISNKDELQHRPGSSHWGDATKQSCSVFDRHNERLITSWTQFTHKHTLHLTDLALTCTGAISNCGLNLYPTWKISFYASFITKLVDGNTYVMLGCHQMPWDPSLHYHYSLPAPSSSYVWLASVLSFLVSQTLLLFSLAYVRYCVCVRWCTEVCACIRAFCPSKRNNGCEGRAVALEISVLGNEMWGACIIQYWPNWRAESCTQLSALLASWMGSRTEASLFKATAST